MTRACRKCGATKPLSEFHRQPKGPNGRHSWCKPCANQAQKDSRRKNGRPAAKPMWQIKTRYGLTKEQYQAMIAAQEGKCGICTLAMRRICVDHCHASGRVRGLLCHRCNIRLSAIDDRTYREAALAYLEKHQ